MDLINPDTLYVIKRSEGVLKTTDGGDSWWSTRTAQGIARLAIHPIETETIYAGGSPGVHRSTDGGTTWALMGSTTVFWIYLDPIDVNTVYGIIAYSGINRMSKSTDGGITWRQLPTEVVGALAIDPTDTQILYLLTNITTLDVPRGVLKSTDGGESWRWVGNFPVSCDNLVLGPSDSSAVYTASLYGLTKSSDGGETWTFHRLGLVTSVVGRVVVSPSDTSKIYGDLWKSLDAGESWSLIESALAGSSETVLAVDPIRSDTVYGMGRDQGQYVLKKSTDGGDRWVTILRPLGGPVAIAPNEPDTIYASVARSSSTSDVYKSTDGGVSWRVTSTVDTRLFAIDPNDSRVVYTGTFRRGVYKTVDGGLTWFASGLDGDWIFSITIDGKNPQNVYAAANGGVFKSDNGGGRWTRLGTIGARGLLLDPKNANILYAAGSQNRGVYKSVDGGQTWAVKNRGLTVTTVYNVAMARDSGRIYAGTGGAGVWFSDDGAETWQ